MPTTEEPVEYDRRHDDDRSRPTTPAPAPTSIVELLDGIVEDAPPASLATTTLTDDTGRLRMDVPEEWSDRRTEPSRLADGTDTPALAASPDLTAFLDGFETPGITALVVADTPRGALGAYAFGESCTAGRSGSYQDDDRRGQYLVWESCGGTINDIVTLAVREPGADESVLLLVQVVGAADVVALDLALDSLALGG